MSGVVKEEKRGLFAEIFSRKNLFSLILIAVAGVMITVLGILTSQEVLRIVPLYVSLAVGMLQAGANRYANLLGGLNSILYAVVYFSFGLYAMTIYCVLVSFPVQIITFIRWSRSAYKSSTMFKRLTPVQLVILLIAFALCYIAINFILTNTDAKYPLIDNASTLVGIVTMLLSMLSFREYSWFMLAGSFISIALDISMMQDHPAQITYLVFSIYSLICVMRQFFSVRRLYREQTEERCVDADVTIVSGDENGNSRCSVAEGSQDSAGER